MNESAKEEEEGEDKLESFMVRNDMFNNNHCRQTTSIPFLKMKPGATFT